MDAQKRRSSSALELLGAEKGCSGNTSEFSAQEGNWLGTQKACSSSAP